MLQSQLIISPKGKLMAMRPHYLLINDQLLGVFKGNEAHVNLPPGRYKVTIRSMYKFIESSADVYIPIRESKCLTFTDKDKIWNRLFNIDLILWFLKRILHVPEPWEPSLRWSATVSSPFGFSAFGSSAKSILISRRNN